MENPKEWKEKRKIGHEVRTLDNLLMRNMLKHIRQETQDEVTAMNGWILMYLFEHQGRDIFQRDIEAEFEIGRSTVTNIVKLMEAKQMLYREGIPGDARMKKLVLTEKGYQFAGKTNAMIQEMDRETLQGISREELDCFYRVMDRIRNNIDYSHHTQRYDRGKFSGSTFIGVF